MPISMPLSLMISVSRSKRSAVLETAAALRSTGRANRLTYGATLAYVGVRADTQTSTFFLPRMFVWVPIGLRARSIAYRSSPGNAGSSCLDSISSTSIMRTCSVIIRRGEVFMQACACSARNRYPGSPICEMFVRPASIA